MSAKDDLKKAKDALADPRVTTFEYKGKKYTLTQLRDSLIPQLEKAAKTESDKSARTDAGKRGSGPAIADAQAAVTRAETALASAKGSFAAGRINESALKPFQDTLNAAQTKLNSLTGATTAGVAPAVAPVRATAQMRGEGMGPTATTASSTGTVTTPTATPTATSATPAGSSVSAQSATSATDQKTFVDSELTKRKLKDTPANRAKLRQEFQTKNKPVDDMAWMDEFKKTYTAYSDWTTNDVIDHFGQDFVDILKEAVNTEFTDEEIQARIKGTQYFKSITDSQYKFDGANSAVQNGLIQTARDAIVKDYADVGLTQTDIDEIAKKVARNGLTATGVKQAVYQYAFRKPEAATTPTSPGMARNAIEGGDADAIRIAARAYGYNVSDAEMQAALTGGMYNGFAVTKDSILEKAQKSAKGKYFHLADQIDAGLSLEDIFSGYRNYAADALEIDPNQIDFTKDSKWARAFGTKETGQMSLTDWVTTIKSDPTFGWQYTKQANQQATDIALTLARAFGKVG
jgi:hypothetical protein